MASTVKVERALDGWRLMKDGTPYFVKGACVWGHEDYNMFAPLKELAAAGANSARTYHEKDAQSTLDRAAQLGLTVTLGFDITPARSGTDFGDATTIASLEARLRRYVEKYKNHPALLAWGIGNEVELMRNDPREREQIFRALNRLARVVKELDPNHPTVVVTAGMDASKAAHVNAFCPDVDIIGINSYAPLVALPAKLTEWKFERPYFVTEWGPNGHWESPQTAWKAPVEPTSSQKAAQIERAYQSGILGDSLRCLGSYVFFWGHKQEATATWFGLFLKSGERVSTQDTLTKLWTEKAPEFPAPTISPITVAGERFAPGAQVLAEVTVISGRPLQIEWLLARESDDRKNGGDAERAPEYFKTGITDLGNGNARITAPQAAGAYRIFVFARDDKGGVATANFPFLIETT
ncbi:MAG TPA: glycoside hydrolase family 2 TIM barrel-domain containing protein [Abditibacteriaceae bacterium]